MLFFVFGTLTATFVAFLVFCGIANERQKELKRKVEREKEKVRVKNEIDSLYAMMRRAGQQPPQQPQRPKVEVGEVIAGQLPGETANEARKRMRAEEDDRRRRQDEENNRNRGEDILNGLLAGSTYDSSSSSYDSSSSDSGSSYDSSCSDSGSSDSGGGDCGGGDF